RSDPTAQQVISEFCELINFPYQQQQGLFATGFYMSVLPPAGNSKVAGLIPAVESEMPEVELNEDIGVEEELANPAPSPLESTEKPEPQSEDEAFSRG